MRSWGHVGLLLAAVLLAGCSPGDGGSEVTIPADKASALVLQPDDLGEVFVRFDEGPLAIADAPGGERADPARFGRAAGWKARYRRQGNSRTSGPLVVESRVDVFDGSGAGREFELHRDELALQARHPSALETAELPELGDEAIALAPARQVSAGSIVSITVAWRAGNVTASVTTNGFGGKLVLADALKLARAQQRRIEAASASAA